mgnify:CR=1 FL=1
MWYGYKERAAGAWSEGRKYVGAQSGHYVPEGWLSGHCGLCGACGVITRMRRRTPTEACRGLRLSHWFSPDCLCLKNHLYFFEDISKFKQINFMEIDGGNVIQMDGL